MDTTVYESLASVLWPSAPRLDAVKWVWFRQSLSRDPHTNGIVQLSNGPCGILAALQAYVVQQIYFPGAAADITHPSGAAIDEAELGPADVEDFGSLSDARITEATSAAIARMLWVVALATSRDKGGAETRPAASWVEVAEAHRSEVMAACLAACEDFSDPFERSKGESSVRSLEWRELTSETELREAVAASLPFLCAEGAPSAVLLVFSLLLTRGPARVGAEMRKDPSAATMVYEDGCSEQALVNLALTGRACNFVDDARWAGWTGRPLVGFLTDAAGFRPGDCFLHPSLPIFVVHSGGHYTTAWSGDLAAAAVEDTPPLPPREAGAAGPATAEPEASNDAGEPGTPGACQAMGPGAPVGSPMPLPAGVAAGSEACPGPSAASTAGSEAAGPLQAATPVAGSGSGSSSADGCASASASDSATEPALHAPWEWRSCPPVHTFWHYNGLHPLHADGHPTRLARFELGMYGPMSAPSGGADEAGASDAESVREAENRARKVKRVLQHRVAEGGSKEGGPFEFLVVCEPDGSMEGSAGLDLPPYWPARWYCRDCTIAGDWGGYNAAEAMECKACGKPARECGWAHWLRADQLPRDTLATWMRSHAPAALQVMRVRWPRASAVWHGPPPAMFG